MGSTSLRRRVVIAAVMISLAVAPLPAYATYPVIDMSAIAKFQEAIAEAKKQLSVVTDQLKTLKDSLSVITDVRKVITDVQDAIGEAISWVIPLTSLPSIKRQIKSNLQCLSDMDQLIPDIDFNDVDFGSLCGARSALKTALFAQPTTLKGQPLPVQNAQRTTIRLRRQEVLADAATEALAASMATTKQTIADMSSTADQLQSALNGAKTVNERLAVLGQIEIARYRADAQQMALTASMLRLQGALALHRDVPIDAQGTSATGGTP